MFDSEMLKPCQVQTPGPSGGDEKATQKYTDALQGKGTETEAEKEV